MARVAWAAPAGTGGAGGSTEAGNGVLGTITGNGNDLTSGRSTATANGGAGGQGGSGGAGRNGFGGNGGNAYGHRFTGQFAIEDNLGLVQFGNVTGGAGGSGNGGAGGNGGSGGNGGDAALPPPVRSLVGCWATLTTSRSVARW